MKSKITTALATIINVAFLSVFCLLISCTNKESGKADRASSVVEAPEVDIHTAVLTGNQAALKQHIEAGSNLNEKDPFGGSSPLITASVFGKTDEAKILIDAGADL